MRLVHNSARGLLVAMLLILTGCGGLTTADEAGNISSKAEESYCSTNYPTPTPHTITGTANYNYRATNCTAGGCTGLAAGASTRGIPRAELIIKNSSGAVVQCGHTNADGTFSVVIDKVPGTYTVTVNSRADNADIKVSVLNDVSNNLPYSLNSTSFTVSSGSASPQAIGTLTANISTSEQKGAAFHILYNIWTANEFLKVHTNNASFVADKVTVYWKAGFNPGSYVGTTSALSFYIKGSDQLYILGGMSGNYTTSDFDHFDDSVILHEYGHFLEDNYSKSDSQGGSHNGDFVIDARLAWSEGFANFFQGAVIRQISGSANRGRFYVDVVNGSNAMLIFNLTESGLSASKDRVQNAGEGVFREISVSRTLWKTTAENGTSTLPAPGEVPFSAVWKAFTDSIYGIKNSLDYFRNSGLFNSYLHQIISSEHATRVPAWQAILDDEYQNRDTRDYADPVSSLAMGACASKYPRTLDPLPEVLYGGTSPRSHLLRSNDFYKYTHNGAGGSLSISYSQLGSPVADLDLYLYRDGYVYQEDYTEALGQATGGVIAKSDRANPVGESGSETINLSGLAAGVYLINVKVNTFNKISADVNTSSAAYTLRLTQGATTWDLCPAN